MKVIVYTEKEFERQLRKLSKKYRSIVDDYDTFLDELEKDPYQGSSLGRGVRKVSMAIASKGIYLPSMTKAKSPTSPTTLSNICLISERIYNGA